MGYPTPEQLRAHAAGARQMAEEYRAEGNPDAARRREDHAEFYDNMADREEERLARRQYRELAA